MFRSLAVGAGFLALACARPEPPTTPQAEANAEPALHASLLALGGAALERSEFSLAETRFERALAAWPVSAEARAGLGRVALARGDLTGAEGLFEEALARDPDSFHALLGLGEVQLASDDPDHARETLERAQALDPQHPGAHHAFARATGRGPRAPPPTVEAARERLARHPYDPAARVEAADRLAREGHVEEAVKALEQSLWLFDLDPPAATRALTQLRSLDPGWRERRVVQVHVYADESVRSDPAWRFRLRLLWLWTSKTLETLLDVRFVPARVVPFSSAGVGASLAAIQAAFRTQAPTPRSGIVALFTGRSAPRARGVAQLGAAEFLGRQMAGRLVPRERVSWVLAHETLHLYGGVHVSDSIDSLMNASRERCATPVLDSLNARIVEQLRARRFGPGGFEAEVYPYLDVHETAQAYLATFRANLAFRRLGLHDAVRRARTSRYGAARVAREVTRLDPHLADVARFAALLLVRDDRPAEGLLLLDTAAALYGRRTAKGREVLALFRQVERQYFSGLGRR